MRFCPNCGKPLMDGSVFCGHCGYKLPEDLLNDDDDHKLEESVIDDNQEMEKNSIEDEDQVDLDSAALNDKVELDEDQKEDNDQEIIEENDLSEAIDENVQNEDENSNKKFEFDDTNDSVEEENKEETISEDNTNNDSSPESSKQTKKALLIALCFVLAVGVFTGGFYFLNKKSDTTKTKSSSLTSTVKTKSDDKIHITLSAVEPAYTVNENNADIDYTKTKFHWRTDSEGTKSQEIINNIKNEYFKYSKSTGLKNGEEVTVTINIDEDDYTVTGQKSFVVNYDTSKYEARVNGQTVDERIRDADGYVFENSDSEYLTASQLSSIKTPTQLRIAINEIYARHGYSFINNPSIQRYFDAKNWYYKDEYLYEDSQMVWNTYEDANLKTLAKLRKGKLKYNPSSELSV
jgi:uncharacterized Zn finger protein (UPF0148 family)